MKISLINSYLAHKQHLLPTSRLADVVRITRDIIALHATDPTSPYISLWARAPDFRREVLEGALYEERTLAKILCMRVTLHAVPSDEVPFFFQAFPQTFFERRTPVAFRGKRLLVQAGICQEEKAKATLNDLYQQIVDVLAEKGPSTVRQISQAVPQLQVKIRHDVGKPYEGEFSIGSRLVPGMCTRGLLIRTRPRGTWRSSLYEYATLPDWLPDVDLESITLQEAQAWLVRRYLSAFGPSTLDDVQWWTGLSKSGVKNALKALKPIVMKIDIEGLEDSHLVLTDDVQRLHDFSAPDIPYVFFLPILDPYIMGYRNRLRFLTPEHRSKVFDRAGNAAPTVWVNGRVVGAWGQRKDGSVIHGLFESVTDQEQALLVDEVRRLENFLGNEHLPPRFRTSFTRALE
ncbi:MAG: winged helix DNA-binding domain-containing protein [Chloroflexi bacterium]|nr:winged helix DNA-binding domain-containing protein [Chloroflexota bacterium]